jgi:hypothetical protein
LRERKQMEIFSSPPENAVILLHGRDLTNWRKLDGSPATWEVADGAGPLRGPGHR